MATVHCCCSAALSPFFTTASALGGSDTGAAAGALVCPQPMETTARKQIRRGSRLSGIMKCLSLEMMAKSCRTFLLKSSRAIRRSGMLHGPDKPVVLLLKIAQASSEFNPHLITVRGVLVQGRQLTALL